MKVRLALLGALGLVALASCGLDNSLGGSLGVVFPLDISKVEVAKNDEAIQITYLRNRGVFLDVVVRVSVPLAGLEPLEDGGVSTVVLKPGTRIVLDDDGGVNRTAVTNAPGGEPVRTLPLVQRGDLVITRGGSLGEVTGGNFSMLFQREGGDIGFGRTLTGTFSATMLDAGFGELP